MLGRSFFGAEMFGEPAWEILLTLFVKAGFKPENVEELFVSCEVPPSIGERWISVLASKSLVYTNGFGSVRLTALGRSSVSRYLAAQLS